MAKQLGVGCVKVDRKDGKGNFAKYSGGTEQGEVDMEQEFNRKITRKNKKCKNVNQQKTEMKPKRRSNSRGVCIVVQKRGRKSLQIPILNRGLGVQRGKKKQGEGNIWTIGRQVE